MNQLGSTDTIGELADFSHNVIQELANAPKGFLSQFSESVDLSDLPSYVTPTSFRVDMTRHIDAVSTGDIAVYVTNKNGVRREVTRQVFNDFLRTYDLHNSPGPRWPTKKNSNRSMSIKQNKKSFSIDIFFKREYTVRLQHGDEIPLARWIRTNCGLDISFTSGEYFYSNGSLCRSGSFSNDIKLVRDILSSNLSIANIKSEKGPYRTYNLTTSAFDPNCLFSFVEKYFGTQSNYLWCSDLADEWADYICVDPGGELKFIHCKGGDVSNGASPCHEVVAQALKNLMRSYSSTEELTLKISQLSANPTWGNTSIQRYRGPGNQQQAIQGCLENRDCRKSVCLVVSSLSLAEFDQQAVTVPHKPYFIQLVWLLSEFANCCRAQGVKPEIICRP